MTSANPVVAGLEIDLTIECGYAGSRIPITSDGLLKLTYKLRSVDADRLSELKELNDIDLSLASFDFRDVGLLPSDPFGKLLLRPPSIVAGFYKHLRESSVLRGKY